jgi:hypothetical protein
MKTFTVNQLVQDRDINGDIIEVGDTLQYMDNPHCLPDSIVTRLTGNNWIYTCNGCGDADKFKIIKKAK